LISNEVENTFYSTTDCKDIKSNKKLVANNKKAMCTQLPY